MRQHGTRNRLTNRSGSSLSPLPRPNYKAARFKCGKWWRENRDSSTVNEFSACERFLHSVSHFQHIAIGLMIDDVLIAFHISALPDGVCANGLFEKADVSCRGVYQALMHGVAKSLIGRGYTELNYEQDLGIENLRRSKAAFNPKYFLKKYTVALK